MVSAQEIFEKLIEDPDLEIGASQTREEAAQIEANYRARQYSNNVKALALAIGNEHARAYNKAKIATTITKEDFKQVSELPTY